MAMRKLLKMTVEAAALSLLFVSCGQKEEEKDVPARIDGASLRIIAQTEATKAAFVSPWETLSWQEGDAIFVWDGVSGTRFTTSESGTRAAFTSTEGIADDATQLYAVFPAEAALAQSEGGVITVSLPEEQSIKAGEYVDPGALLAVAHSASVLQTTELRFLNLCSWLKFTVPSEDAVQELVLQAGEGEYLAGKVKVSFDKKGNPVLSATEEGSSRIRFRSAAPMEGTYVIPLLPCTLQNGLTVTLRTADGRTAVHQVVAKDENDVVSAIVFRRNKVNHYTLSFSKPAWRNAPEVELMDVSATSVSFRWSENGFEDSEKDFAGHYLLALYSDETCETPVRELDWKVDPISSIAIPAFCFTGLEAQTPYYLAVTDLETGSMSPVKAFTTTSAQFLVPGNPVQEGDYALVEDFSELTDGGDPVHKAWGLLDGVLTGKPSDLPEWSETDLSSTRLAAWSEKTEGHDYAGPGYVRAGDSQSQKDAIVTPVLSNLSDCATVTVRFKAAPFSSDYGAGNGASRLGECYAEVWVVNGTNQVSAGVVELTDDPSAWTQCELEVYNVLPTSRIAIGGAYGEKSVASGGKQYARIYLDDISVQVLRYEETVAVVAPELTVGTVFWSDVQLSWTCAGEPYGYKVYVDGTAVATLGADATQYHLGNLPCGTKMAVEVAALYNKGDEGKSQPQYITTGSVERLTRNLSPTSLAFAIENRAGDNTTNNNPLIEVELLDGPDPATAQSVFRSYVLDAQAQSPASPFFGGLIVDQSKSRTPLNVAIGCLRPETDYWFRVRSVESAEFTNYQPSTPNTQTCTSSNGTSDFSVPLKATTPAKHTAQSGEILYEGFDDLMIQADYVNCAVGSVPAFKKEGMKVGNMDLATIRNWDKDWSFYGMRTVFASSQLAPHYAWGTQQTSNDDLFQLSAQSSSGTIKGTAPGVGAKVYKFKDTAGSLAGWYSSNNTFAGQGFIELGAYYNASDSKAQVLGMIVTPELSGPLSDSEVSCSLRFKGLVLQGQSCKLGIWRYSAGSWTKVADVDLYNSAGTTETVTSWSALSETHKWYGHNLDLSLKAGDRIALEAPKADGAALIDDIQITIQ